MHHADPDQGAALEQLRPYLDQNHVALLGKHLSNKAAARLDLA